MKEIIFPLKSGMQSDAVANLQDALQLCLEKAAFLVTDDAARKKLVEALKRERTKQSYGEATGELVGLFQDSRGLERHKHVDERTATALNELLRNWDRLPSRDPSDKETPAKVTGTIILEHGSPASKVTVLLYRRGFGGARTLLKKAQTDERGAYAIPYSTHGPANIEIYAIGADGTEVQLSQTKVSAQADECIDLIAPSHVQPVEAEFARLKLAVAPHTGNKPETLKDAVERGDRRDFTYLASATGWDAAAMALAAEAFDGEAHTRVPAEGLYALARAGFPMDLKILARVCVFRTIVTAYSGRT